MTSTPRSRAPRSTRPNPVVELRPRTAGAARERPTKDAHQLTSRLSARWKTEPHHRRLLEIVIDTVGRADRVPPEHAEAWSRFLWLLERHGSDPRATPNCAVMANLVGLALFDDLSDYEALADLGARHGHWQLAKLQHRCGRFLETNPGLPLTTLALRRLVCVDVHRRLSTDPALPAGRAGRLAEAGHHAAKSLLVQGVDPGWSVPLLQTPVELLDIAENGTIVEWRHHVAMVTARPWSPYAGDLVELARKAGLPQAAAVIEDCVELCREQQKEDEREAVAQEIKRLVAVSGVTQREFAQWIGTSASRLSTYVSGSVTPSAAIMLRISRAAAELQRRAQSDLTPRNGLLSLPGGAGRDGSATG